MIKTIAYATGNPHKAAEFKPIFDAAGITLFKPPVDTDHPNAELVMPEETEDTYQGNALIKARHFAKLWQVPCVASDSGLAVVGLRGLPGPWSARFGSFDYEDAHTGSLTGTLHGVRSYRAGRPDASVSNNLLLRLMYGKRGDAWLACFVDSIVLVDPSGVLLYATEARWHGRILETPRGTEGFGYDPIMETFDYPGRSVAELSVEEKNAVSHRGQTTRNLLAWLKAQQPKPVPETAEIPST